MPLADSVLDPRIETAGVISKPGIDHASVIVPELLRWLEAHGINVRCDPETASYAGRNGGMPREEVPDGAQLLIVLGGDGTLLSAARAVRGREIPIFPVNLGGLGFLTAITLDELYPQLERALRGEQRIAHRRMLKCELVRDGVSAEYEALNDVVLAKIEMARMMDVETYVDNHYVSTFKADGLIVCTPTGSTAYSLSAGGPIIFPAVAALCITPICPHMLTNRPVIVPDTSIIRIVCLAEDRESYLTIDGQVGQALMKNDEILCHSSGHTVALVRPPKMMFFDVLRQKLKWGER